MSSTKDIKEAPKKAKSPAKFDNLSTALKKNLQRRKKVKTKDTTSQALSALQTIVKNYTDSTDEKISLVDELIKSRRLETESK
ncbi:hypothetical protein ASQ44_02425 [Rickettsia rhipicephali]|uniref:Uncharacterized protein n=3 Tax=spotted fever group TaxID=114277 RepID=A0A0F3PG12_RICRH|nr:MULTISPECIES: hypothetical protein [spotted fever group]AFB31470.1 hypothetical protein RMB_03175 [Rickettsia massiliae str. AZT80]AFC72688.1 hypothetical protein MCC_05925 [Rickettsia rhipicephali str. 3-7-female6-CWPP]ALN41065.1 hypothetical protein ASQ44_02425 [Rickettsia rhipicephali]KJV79305.1 hypothetical protein RMAECT_0050 [Rickettsia rhipicephali str. Ect]MCX4080353.1 hypothetical protein [Rickettsia rhipicephali]